MFVNSLVCFLNFFCVFWLLYVGSNFISSFLYCSWFSPTWNLGVSVRRYVSGPSIWSDSCTCAGLQLFTQSTHLLKDMQQHRSEILFTKKRACPTKASRISYIKFIVSDKSGQYLKTNANFIGKHMRHFPFFEMHLLPVRIFC